MKRSYRRKLAIALALATVPLLMGCGSNRDSGQVGNVPGAIVPGIGVPGACIPITQQIPFAGTNIYFSGVNIRGGQIPYSTPVGQMGVGGPGGGGPLGRTAVDGSISMNVTPVNQAVVAQPYPTTYPTYPTNNNLSNTANVTGILTISNIVQQDIQYQSGSYSGANNNWYNYGGTPGVPQPYAPAAIPCVSGIAIDGAHYYNTIYSTKVYLYLNNTQHGYIMYFGS
ncbi:MAG: hypothetical protein NDJ89_16060 [Oligoflexia bacterium]|nr:hypothetical protein [Oligoflexia bacterium]